MSKTLRQQSLVIDCCFALVFLVPTGAWYWSLNHLRAFENANARIAGTVKDVDVATGYSPVRKTPLTGRFVDIDSNGQTHRFWADYAAEDAVSVLRPGDHVEILATKPDDGFLCALWRDGKEIVAKDTVVESVDAARGWIWRVAIPIISVLGVLMSLVVILGSCWIWGRKKCGHSGFQ